MRTGHDHTIGCDDTIPLVDRCGFLPESNEILATIRF
jgi:hypothetical protein